jgi:uncharacterized Fe-S radical SAM superfamily protein PflX
MHAAPIESDLEPLYLTLFRSGQLAERAKRAAAHLASCDLCARYCRVDRFLGVKGAVCRTGVRAMVSSFGPHYGEERPLSGTRGSGTTFFRSHARRWSGMMQGNYPAPSTWAAFFTSRGATQQRQP